MWKHKRCTPSVHTHNVRLHCLDGGRAHSGHLVGEAFEQSSVESGVNEKGLESLHSVGLGDHSDGVRCTLTRRGRLLVAEGLDSSIVEADRLEGLGAILLGERSEGRCCGLVGRLVGDEETGIIKLAVCGCDGSLERAGGGGSEALSSSG